VGEVVDSGGLRLAAHLARPSRPADTMGPVPGLVLCHGFPAGPKGAAGAAQTYPQFADRLAADAGWMVLSFNLRGTGASEGDFSLAGWLDDVRAAVEHLLTVHAVGGVWLAGSSTGGSLAICAAADDERVRGVAVMAAPADFDEWASDAGNFVEYARRVGVIRDPDFPPDPAAWGRELREVRPLAAVARIPPRPLLLMHGSEDEVVPLEDARALADAAGGDVELRVIQRAGHRLRHDPRAVAVLLGWLQRQRLS
jgi:pimeloyl-ACP methyl ester carboxylesterase